MTDPVDDLRLQISSDSRLLGVARGVLQMWLEIRGLEADRRGEIVLAVDEACANAIRHAYGGRTDGRIELVLSSTDDWIQISVSDQGLPCPPERSAYRPLERPTANDVRPGGLGVKLIHEVFDDVHFCSGPSGGNCVTMRLRRTMARGDDSED